MLPVQGSIPGQGTKIPHATQWHSQKIITVFNMHLLSVRLHQAKTNRTSRRNRWAHHHSWSLQLPLSKRDRVRDFPGGPVVKSLPGSAGDMGSVSGQGTKIPHAMEQLSLWASTRQTTHHTKNSTWCSEDPLCSN